MINSFRVAIITDQHREQTGSVKIHQIKACEPTHHATCPHGASKHADKASSGSPQHLQEFAKIYLANIVIWQLAKIYGK
jgi:hypothetical protein